MTVDLCICRYAKPGCKKCRANFLKQNGGPVIPRRYMPDAHTLGVTQQQASEAANKQRPSITITHKSKLPAPVKGTTSRGKANTAASKSWHKARTLAEPSGAAAKRRPAPTSGDKGKKRKEQQDLEHPSAKKQKTGNESASKAKQQTQKLKPAASHSPAEATPSDQRTRPGTSDQQDKPSGVRSRPKPAGGLQPAAKHSRLSVHGLPSKHQSPGYVAVASKARSKATNTRSTGPAAGSASAPVKRLGKANRPMPCTLIGSMAKAAGTASLQTKTPALAKSKGKAKSSGKSALAQTVPPRTSNVFGSRPAVKTQALAGRTAKPKSSGKVASSPAKSAHAGRADKVESLPARSAKPVTAGKDAVVPVKAGKPLAAAKIRTSQPAEMASASGQMVAAASDSKLGCSKCRFQASGCTKCRAKQAGQLTVGNLKAR